jgi:hypothetical protein
MEFILFFQKTECTTTVGGQVYKRVPCENCPTEYVYMLEREGVGIGTSLYMLNDEEARSHADEAAKDTLSQALENDFDAVPCPVCGHYQRFMFPKLMEERSAWELAARVLALVVGMFASVAGMFWTLAYLSEPTDKALGRMIAAWGTVALAALAGIGLAAARRAREQRFDPNTGNADARIAEGRRRAMTRAEFEASQRQGTATSEEPPVGPPPDQSSPGFSKEPGRDQL